MQLTPEAPQDYSDVEALYDLCFAPGRQLLSSYRLRDGSAPVEGLSMVLRDRDGLLAGAVRYWPIQVSDAPALLLGPLAVHPTHQGEGLGARLIRETMAQAETAGWRRILLIGDLSYYQRFGFSQVAGVLMPAPTNPARILGAGDWEQIFGLVCPLKTGADTNI